MSLYKKHFKTDLTASMVVFLVALPLCLAIALGSDAPLFAGIISGVVGGVIVGLVSNSQINVSGPAAGLVVVTAMGIETLGGFEALLVAIVLAGVLQIVLGLIKAGTIAYFFPSAVIKAILASIGLILIFKQLPHAFGVHEIIDGNKLSIAVLKKAAGNISWGATSIALSALALIVFWDYFLKKRLRWLKLVPSALAAVLLGIGLSAIYRFYFPEFELQGAQFVQLPVASNVGDFAGFFTFPDFSVLASSDVYLVALSIGVIASLESLLSTEAGDKIDPFKRRTSTNRELKAQGLGNVVSGLIGGLPVTVVIVRTSANVQAGGLTKTSAVLHGVILLLTAAFIPNLLNQIPLACLASVLLVVGYKLTNYAIYKGVYLQGYKQFVPFVVTIVAVLLTDLLKGIFIGSATAIFFLLLDNYRNAYLEGRVIHAGKEKLTIQLPEEVTFLNKAEIMRFLDEVPEQQTLVIDGSAVKFIHPDILEIIEDFRENARLKEIELELIGLNEMTKVAR